MDAGDGRTVMLSLVKISSNSSSTDCETYLRWSLGWLLSPEPAWIAIGFEVELPQSLDGLMSPQPAWMVTGFEEDLYWSLVWPMSPLSVSTAADSKMENNVS